MTQTTIVVNLRYVFAVHRANYVTYLLSGLAERDARQEIRNEAQAAVVEAAKESMFKFTHSAKLM